METKRVKILLTVILWMMAGLIWSARSHPIYGDTWYHRWYDWRMDPKTSYRTW